MTGFIRRFRIFTFAIATVLTASVTLADKSYAGATVIRGPMTAAMAGATGTSSSGIWIVGGLAFSVASIVACAMIVGAEEGREMTLEEALLSGAIPMGCLLREQLAAQ